MKLTGAERRAVAVLTLHVALLLNASAATTEVSSSSGEDAQAAQLLSESCEWNTYMCCWTGQEGGGAITGNSDVCRVLNYPEEGDTYELPRSDEGDVYCHGFAWENGADVTSTILPLYQYMKELGDPEGGGFNGNVVGSPQCGCIEEMPVVSDAACSRIGNRGIKECNQNSLKRQYRGRANKPNGDMDFNLVGECDNEDVPVYDFRTCEYNSYMCCWTENDGDGMADNTDVCRVGETEYPGESEGEVHCHGFVWPEDATDNYIHILAQYVQNYDHKDSRGYFGNLPDAPMCGCLEDMPEVTRADCSTYRNIEKQKIKQCRRNDLLRRYNDEFPDVDVPNLVEECEYEGSSS